MHILPRLVVSSCPHLYATQQSTKLKHVMPCDEVPILSRSFRLRRFSNDRRRWLVVLVMTLKHFQPAICVAMSHWKHAVSYEVQLARVERVRKEQTRRENGAIAFSTVIEW